MNVARRRLLQALAAGGGFSAATNGEEPKVSLDVLRDVSRVHGTNLSDTRLQAIQPALERHLSQLRTLRGFAVDDAVGPTEGILPSDPRRVPKV